MMDAMREKLIALLLTEPWTIHARGNSKRFAAAGAVADRLIANGVTIQRRIPVTERLPEKRRSMEVDFCPYCGADMRKDNKEE